MMTEEEQMEAALAASLGREIPNKEASPPPEPAPIQPPNIIAPTTNDEPTIPIPTPSSTTDKSPAYSLQLLRLTHQNHLNLLKPREFNSDFQKVDVH